MTGYRAPLCPVDPTHGPLYDWPTDRWAFHCVHQSHDGTRERPQTRAFFTTTEAQSGVLATRAELVGADTPARMLGL